jgi:hypothetical protein
MRRDILFFAAGALVASALTALAFVWYEPSEPDDPAIFRVIGDITVDDTMSIADLAKAGKYHGLGAGLTTENFPTTRKDKHTAKMAMISFGRSITYDQALAGIAARKEGLRAANLDECLAFGIVIEQRREQEKLAPPRRTATCLGQSAVINGKPHIPVLWSVEYGDWNAGTEPLDTVWTSRRRFLVVFKQ